jgi:hypothetical protein
MNMTLNHNAVIQNFPECEGMRIDEVRVVTDIPASTRDGGKTTLAITRLTSEYYDVKEISA